MKSLQARVRRLLTLGAVAAAVSWGLFVAWIDHGGHTPPVPWTVPAVLVVVAVGVLAAGLPVRRWVRQGQSLAAGDAVDRKNLDPIAAARTLTLAVACAYAGAVLAGWYAAQALAEFTDVPAGRGGRILDTGLAAGASLVLCVAGLLVQRWCRVPPEDPRA